MKIIVSGGRDFKLWAMLRGALDYQHKHIEPITCIVHGGASGADDLAQAWAEENCISTKIYPADWDKHGRAAGPIRNKAMLEENPDAKMLVVFPGGKGTANMLRLAKEAGLKTIGVESWERFYDYVSIAAIDTMWMARRYADGRKTFAAHIYNRALDRLGEVGIGACVQGDRSEGDKRYADDGSLGEWDPVNSKFMRQ